MTWEHLLDQIPSVPMKTMAIRGDLHLNMKPKPWYSIHYIHKFWLRWTMGQESHAELSQMEQDLWQLISAFHPLTTRYSDINSESLIQIFIWNKNLYFVVLHPSLVLAFQIQFHFDNTTDITLHKLGTFCQTLEFNNSQGDDEPGLSSNAHTIFPKVSISFQSI